jgi:transposase
MSFAALSWRVEGLARGGVVLAKPLVPDDLWEVVRPILPPPRPRRFDHPGRKPTDDRACLTGILFVLKTGIPWEDLPQEMGCGCGMTCWRRLRDWQQAGVWLRLHAALLARLRGADRIDWSRAALDSSFARALGGVEGSGPNPTDRGRPGVKHHVLTDANGIPLAADVTGANAPDVTELLPLVDGIGPVGGKPGRPRRRPESLYGDRAYDSEAHRDALRSRGIEPRLARRYTEHGSGLGVFRWVAERTLSWLHGFRKLRLVTEKGQDMQYAFLTLAISLICFRLL